MLEQLIKVINHTFDFCKKISVNMELMQSNTAHMATYDIVIGITQLTLTMLANIEMAIKSDYGCEFCSAMHAIHKKYTYNHVQDATSLQAIFTELAGANGVRALKDASALNAGTAYSVANSVLSFLNSMMMNGNTYSKNTESAYGASSDSGSFVERLKSCNREHMKTKKPKSCENKKKEKHKNDEPKMNTCLHCKKYHR